MVRKLLQNTITKYDLFIGVKKGEPIYVTMKVVTTNKSLIVYTPKGTIYGQSRVVRAKDFDYDSMLMMALEKSGSKLEVA